METETVPTYAALLQVNDFASVHVRTCRREVIRYVSACYSGLLVRHAELVDNGLARYLVELERSECKRGHEERRMFLLGRLNVQNIPSNSSQDHTVMLAGSAGHDATECTATTYHDAYGSWTDVVVTATVNIRVEDYETPVQLNSGKVILPSGLRCDLSNEFCIDRDGSTVYWDAIKRGECGKNEYTVLYEGTINKTTEKGAESKPLYSIDTPDVVFAFSHKGNYDICMHRFIRTEYPKLFIVELKQDEILPFQTTVSVENLDLMSYVNSKFVYVEKQLKRHLNTLYRDVIEKRCNLERKVIANTLSIGAQKPDEFALRLKGRPGYIGILGGEVIYVAKCTPVIVQPRETTECYNELPVSRNGEAMFLTERTRILTHIGVRTTCDEKLPTMYFLSGKWIKFLPIRAIADPPTILKPGAEKGFVYEESKYISRGGIYTQAESEKIKERAMFAVVRPGVISTIAQGMLGSNVTQELTIEPFLKKEHVEGLLMNMWGNFWAKFVIFGSTTAGVIGILVVAKLIKFALDTVIHGIALHEVYGFSFHLIGAIWDSVTQLLLHWGNTQGSHQKGKIRQKKQANKGSSVETSDHPEEISREIMENETYARLGEPEIHGRIYGSTQLVPTLSRNPSFQLERTYTPGGYHPANLQHSEFPTIYPRILSKSTSHHLGQI